MKSKSILFTMAVLTGLLAWQGCKDKVPVVEDPPFEISIPALPSSITFPVQNGLLAFSDFTHLELAKAQLFTRTPSELNAFRDSIGFLTQGEILRMVDSAESAHEVQFYAPLPDTLTPAQYAALRPGYQPDSVYTRFEQAGLVEIIIDPTGGRAIELTMKESSMKEVLNAQGEVIVGDRKYVYTDTTMRVYDFAGNLLETTPIGKRDDVQTNFNRCWHLGGASVPCHYNVWITDPCRSSIYRIAAKAVFTSRNLQTIMRPQFYLTVDAEMLLNSRWQNTPRYQPLLRVNGNWQYRYWIKTTNQVVQERIAPTDFLPDIYPNSPRTFITNGVNAFFQRLNPSSQLELYGGTFNDNIEMQNINFTLAFSGCTNGYTFVLQ